MAIFSCFFVHFEAKAEQKSQLAPVRQQRQRILLAVEVQLFVASDKGDRLLACVPAGGGLGEGELPSEIAIGSA